MRILICTDGSAHAENAIRFAGLIASAADAETTLLGITEDESEKNPVFDSLKHGQKILNDLKVKAEATIKTGDPLKEIVKHTQENQYDLVVIGAARKGSRGPFIISSKAYKIVKEVEPPVLVVTDKRKELKRILICTGDRKSFDEAIEVTAAIAKAAGARVTLFHVAAEPPLVYADLIHLEEDVDLLLESNSALAKKLKSEQATLTKAGVAVDVKLRLGHVTDQVLKELRREDSDLVVAGSSRNTGRLRNYMIGNITREIVNRAACPVLVVRTDEGALLGRRLKKMFSKVTDALSAQAG